MHRTIVVGACLCTIAIGCSAAGPSATISGGNTTGGTGPTPSQTTGQTTSQTPPTSQPSPLATFVTGSYQVVNTVSNLAISVPAANANDGTPLDQTAFTGQGTATWAFTALSPNIYLMQNPATGKCVDGAQSNVAQGAQLVISSCNRMAASQQWTPVKNGNNVVMRNLASNECMSIITASQGTPVVQAACDNTAMQQWQVLSRTVRKGYALVTFNVDPPNSITHLDMDWAVPAQPGKTGVLFLVASLQPSYQSTNLLPLGVGWLESTVTWGQSCAPVTQPVAYSTWWVSGQYVNESTTAPAGFMGCYSGPALSIKTGSSEHTEFDLQGTKWTVTITDSQTLQTSTYTVDLGGQGQSIFTLNIQPAAGGEPVSDVLIRNIAITTALPASDVCTPNQAGLQDYVAPGSTAMNVQNCTVSQITLRAQGVPATTVNP